MKLSNKKILFFLPVLLLAYLLMSPVCLQAQVVPAQPAEKTDLTLNVIGAYPGNVTPARDNRFFLEIRNNGTATVNNIRFSFTAPEGWTVDFQPDGLDTLAAGSSQTIDVNIIPSGSTSDGDYNLTLLAQANETRGVTSLYVNVEGGLSYWLWVGIGLGVLVVIGFIIVYIRAGK